MLATQTQHLSSHQGTCTSAEQRGQYSSWPRGARLRAKRSLHCCQDACSLQRGSMFRGTRADSAPLTHFPVHETGCWEALFYKPTHGHLYLRFSRSALYPAPQQELTQGYPATLPDTQKHLKIFQPAWIRQPEPFSLLFWHIWGFWFLQRKPDSQKQNYWE